MFKREACPRLVRVRPATVYAISRSRLRSLKAHLRRGLGGRTIGVAHEGLRDLQSCHASRANAAGETESKNPEPRRVLRAGSRGRLWVVPMPSLTWGGDTVNRTPDLLLAASGVAEAAIANDAHQRTMDRAMRNPMSSIGSARGGAEPGPCPALESQRCGRSL